MAIFEFEAATAMAAFISSQARADSLAFGEYQLYISKSNRELASNINHVQKIQLLRFTDRPVRRRRDARAAI